VDGLTTEVLRFVTDPGSQPLGDHSLLARLATEKPLIRAAGVWIVSGHDLVSTLARHPACVVRMPDSWSRTGELDRSISTFLEGLLPIRPPADHRRLRRLIAGQFSARSVAALRTQVQAIADELLDEPLRRGRCDFVADVCVPLPVRTTAVMLGLPHGDRDQVLDWARTVNGQIVEEITSRVGGLTREGADRPTEAGARSSLAEVVGYIEDLVRDRTRRPGADLVSRLAAESTVPDGALSPDELVSMVVMLLLTGIDTVGSGLANVVTALGAAPQVWARVVADPRLAGAAYTEGLRLWPALPMMGRITDADVNLAGVRIPAGDTVLLLYGAANLDPAVFTDPTRFDLDRDNARHLSFGHGVHFCPGASLAALQGGIVLDALARRAPGFTVVGTPRRRAESAFHSAAEVPLRLDATAAAAVGV
jgi:cytochrome P450